MCVCCCFECCYFLIIAVHRPGGMFRRVVGTLYPSVGVDSPGGVTSSGYSDSYMGDREVHYTVRQTEYTSGGV